MVALIYACLSEIRCYFGYTVLVAANSLQLCLALCDTIDGSPPGSPILGILQARTLEWVAIGRETIFHGLTFGYTIIKKKKKKQ